MTIIDNHTLRGLLPHSGSMCLLESVASWDAVQISCVAKSHRFPDNPLVCGGVLPVEAGIEYAAQGMAIHGHLSRRESGAPKIGYLAVLSKVRWQVERLDDLPGPLQVEARLLVATEEGSHYEFCVNHSGNELISGQAVVALAGEGKPG